MEEPPASPRTATLFQAIKMVLSAFIGIRKQSAREEIRVTPVQLVIIGIIAAVLFAFTVRMVVRLVLGK